LEAAKTSNDSSYSTESVERASFNLGMLKSDDAVISLQKGYVMTKHSPNTDPHGKFVYLSSDQKDLCWKSLDKKDEKKIELKKIDTILRGN
jgi:hypothetical protein